MKTNILWIMKGAVLNPSVCILLLMLSGSTITSPVAEAQNMQDVKVAIVAQNVTLEETLKLIEQKTDFKFVYDNDDLPLNKKTEINLADGSLTQVLENMARNFNLTFNRIDHQIVVKTAVNNNGTQGELRGIVNDSVNREPIIGANIIVLGTSLGCATNTDGEYKIVGIPEKPYRIKISCIGYEPYETVVDFSITKTSTLDVLLKPAIILGEEVIVTAQMRGQQAAINEQITSNTAVNVVSADRIQELPDANAAESIGRLPGISLIRSGGEASKVVVRGLEPKLNSITINGIKVPSTDDADRSVDLSMISSQSLEGIEVFKAITPDHDADAIGAAVNLRIKKAPKERNIRLRIDGGYNQIKNYWGNYELNGEYSDRYFGDKLGLVGTASYEKINRSSERWTAGYNLSGPTGDVTVTDNSVGLTNNIDLIKRLSGGLTLDYVWKNGSVWLSSFYSSRQTNPFNISVTYNGTTGTAGSIGYGVGNSKGDAEGFSNSFNGEVNLLGADVDWVLSRYYTKGKTTDGYSMSFSQSSAFNPSINPTDNATYISSAKENFGLMTLTRASLGNSYTFQTDLAAVINIKVPCNLGSSIAGFLKVGGKYISSEKVRDNFSIAELEYTTALPTGTAINRALGVLPNLILTHDGSGAPKFISAANFVDSQTDFETILKGGGDYRLWPVFNLDQIKEFINVLEPTFRVDKTAGKRNYNLRETVTSGYIMAQVNFGQVITIIPGVRYEFSDNRYDAKFSTLYSLYGEAGLIKDTTSAKKYGYWFPGLHMKIKPLDWFDVKLSANRTIARPNYSWIIPYADYDVNSQNLSAGNTELKEMTAWNYNATLSFYNNLFGLFAVSGFYKDLNNIFYGKPFVVFTPEDIEKFKIPGGAAGYTVDYYTNSKLAIVKGFELELQTQLAYIPGIPAFLRGIVLNANYSRIWSTTIFPEDPTLVTVTDRTVRPPKIKIVDVIYGTRRGPMPGQADQIANIAVGYDIAGFSVRVSLLYQGSSLTSIAAKDPAWDGYNDAFWRWDASAKYRITNYIALTSNVQNITNRPDRAFMGSFLYQTNSFYYGMTGKAGVEVNL